MTLLTKKKLAKGSGPTGITLFFEGTKFRATLVKFDKVRYKKVADIVEGAFKRAFGDSYTHKRGTREWFKVGADPERADMVASYLNNFPEVISPTYDQTERPTGMFTSVSKAIAGVKKSRRVRANKAAIDVLRRSVFGGEGALGIDAEIADGEKRINNLTEELRRAQNGLEGLKVKRAQLLETIRSLGGSTL